MPPQWWYPLVRLRFGCLKSGHAVVIMDRWKKGVKVTPFGSNLNSWHRPPTSRQ